MNIQQKATVKQQEASLKACTIDGLDQYARDKKIGAGNFTVLEGRIGMEKIAIKSIYYKTQNYPRDAVIKEMYAMFACSGGRNIINFVGWQEDKKQGCIYVATGNCEGGNLSHWVRFKGKRTPLEKFEMLKGVIAGISYIHFKGFIHNDIKPDNVFICNGEPKIADFGSVGFPGERIHGTPGFICPESKDSGGDEKSDTYSFGVTAYQMYSEDFSLKLHLSDFKLTEATIPDALVLQILQRALVPKAQRMTAREIIEHFPTTSTLPPVREPPVRDPPEHESPLRERTLKGSKSANNLAAARTIGGNQGERNVGRRPTSALDVHNEEGLNPPEGPGKPWIFGNFFARWRSKPDIPENSEEPARKLTGYDSQRKPTPLNSTPEFTPGFNNSGNSNNHFGRPNVKENEAPGSSSKKPSDLFW